MTAFLSELKSRISVAQLEKLFNFIQTRKNKDARELEGFAFLHDGMDEAGRVAERRMAPCL
jgi:hypothetical protein